MSLNSALCRLIVFISIKQCGVLSFLTHYPVHISINIQYDFQIRCVFKMFLTFFWPVYMYHVNFKIHMDICLLKICLLKLNNIIYFFVLCGNSGFQNCSIAVCQVFKCAAHFSRKQTIFYNISASVSSGWIKQVYLQCWYFYQCLYFLKALYQ